MSRTRPWRRSALAVVAVAGIAACTTPDERIVVPLVYDLDHDPTTRIAEVDPDRGEVVPAEELRAILEAHLGWHGISVTQAMRAAADGDADEWVAALVANTEDITAAVGLVYGPVAAGAFNQQWAQHTQFLIDVAVAEANGDRSAALEALDHLEAYATDSGSFFGAATDDRLPATAVTGLLREHVGHMVEQLRAHLDGDVERSVALAVDDHAHLLVVGGALADAIADQFPDQFPGSTTSDRALFRSDVALGAGRVAHAGLTGLTDLTLEFCGDLDLLVGPDPEVEALLTEFRLRVDGADQAEAVTAARGLSPAVDEFAVLRAPVSDGS